MLEPLGSTAPARKLLLVGGHGRSRGSAAMRALAIAAILVGTLALLDALITLVWQEPISALYATVRQHELSGALHAAESASPSAPERRTLGGLADERARIAYLAEELERHSRGGAAVGRIVIPRVNASYVVVKGTDTDDLISGPGIYPETSFPGRGTTTAIAGHRTTYLAPFREINLLVPGNHILLNMPYAQFTFTVTGQRVVSPSDVRAATAKVGYPRLVLSACTPVFSAEKRLLVYARLTRVVPVGAAVRLANGAQAVPMESVPHGARAPRRALPAMLVSLEPDSASPLV